MQMFCFAKLIVAESNVRLPVKDRKFLQNKTLHMNSTSWVWMPCVFESLSWKMTEEKQVCIRWNTKGNKVRNIITCQPATPPIWWRVQSPWWRFCRCHKTRSWTSCLCVESLWRAGSPSPEDTSRGVTSLSCECSVESSCLTLTISWAICLVLLKSRTTLASRTTE